VLYTGATDAMAFDQLKAENQDRGPQIPFIRGIRPPVQEKEIKHKDAIGLFGSTKGHS